MGWAWVGWGGMGTCPSPLCLSRSPGTFLPGSVGTLESPTYPSDTASAAGMGASGASSEAVWGASGISMSGTEAQGEPLGCEGGSEGPGVSLWGTRPWIRGREAGRAVLGCSGGFCPSR